MPTRMRCRGRRDERRLAAEQRQEDRNLRGDAGQLMRLQHLGFGECEEARRLHLKLSGGNPVTPSGVLEKEET